MTDHRGLRLGQLVERLGGRLCGDPELRVCKVGTLSEAGPKALTFLANSRYRDSLPTTKAGCVVLAPKDAIDCPVACIETENPYLYYARAAALVVPAKAAPHGIHPTATVADTAQIGEGAWIGPGSVIEENVAIGGGAIVGANCYIGRGAQIGMGTHLVGMVTVVAGCRIGAYGKIQPGAVIGGDGFGLAWDDSHWERVPQLGNVVVGDYVDIGANTTIDRGAIGNTVIEDGVKLDNLIQVGHNVRIGAHTAIAGCTGISGSTNIGRRCLIGGQVGIAGHLQIADGTVITGKTLVNHSILTQGKFSGALPMDDSERWRKNSARFRRLDQMARRITKLERESSGK